MGDLVRLVWDILFGWMLLVLGSVATAFWYFVSHPREAYKEFFEKDE